MVNPDFFYFGRAARLFGAYYPAPTENTSNTGKAVVVCPPFGHDLIQYYDLLVGISNRLAEASVPTLRFDFFGCGDSFGGSADWGLEEWSHDFKDAMAILNSRSSATHLFVVAFGVGANIACLASPGLDAIRGACLWRPVLDGRRYLGALAKRQEEFCMERGIRVSGGSRGPGELLGFYIHERMKRELETLDLGESVPASRTLLIGGSPERDLLLKSGWCSSDFLDESDGNTPSERTIRRIIDWICAS